MTKSSEAAYPTDPGAANSGGAGSYESPAEHTEGVAGTTYETHQANAYPHGEFASFTCPVCVKRCVDAGQAEVGRPYIVEHADEWAARDGIR